MIPPSHSVNNPFLQPEEKNADAYTNNWTDWVTPSAAPVYTTHPLHSPDSPWLTPQQQHPVQVPQAPVHHHAMQHYAPQTIQPMYAPLATLHQQHTAQELPHAQPMQYTHTGYGYVPAPQPALYTTTPHATTAYHPRMPPLPPPRPPVQHRVAPPPPPRPQPDGLRPTAPPFMNASASMPQGDLGPVPKVFTLSTTGWTADDCLCLEKQNWLAFSVKVRNQLGMAFPGASRFIEPEDGDLNDCPSPVTHLAHYRAWKDTDRVVRSFLSDVCAVTERVHIENLATAKDVWDTLHYCHEALGPTGQLAALKAFAAIHYPADASCLAPTTTLLTQTNNRIWQCGPFHPEVFLVSGIINTLQPHHPALARTILHMPGVTLAMAQDLIATEQAAKIAELAATAVSHEAHVAGTSDCPVICTNTPNCPKPTTHTWPYCTSKGGGMDGHTVAKANEKYRADRGKGPKSGGASKAGQTGTAQKGPHKVDASGRAYITYHGTDFFITEKTTAPAAAATPDPPTANVAHVSLLTDPFPTAHDPEAWLCTPNIDWSVYTVRDGHKPSSYELIANTGARIHITPFKSDFVTFRAIEPHPITGFSGSSICATGIGTVVNSKFTLEYSFFVPIASFRLLSVSRLCKSNKYTFHFNQDSVWVTDVEGKNVCTGLVNPACNLYFLDCTPLPLTAYAATESMRDLRDWHISTGHPSHQAVADMWSKDLVVGTHKCSQSL